MPEGLTGNLAQWPLPDILNMLGASRQTGRLELFSPAGRGDIYLEDGAVVHAACGLHAAEAAVASLVGWPAGSFRFEPHIAAPEHTVSRPLDQLLADCVRINAEREALRRAVPSLEAIPHLSAALPPAPITLQPVEWQILANIDGGRSVADLVSIVGREDLAVMKLLYRLVSAGLVAFEAAKAPTTIHRPTAGPDFFAHLTAATAAAMGPLAEVIIDDEVEALGERRDEFPRDKVAYLVERISAEIRDGEKRVSFQQAMLQAIRAMAA